MKKLFLYAAPRLVLGAALGLALGFACRAKAQSYYAPPAQHQADLSLSNIDCSVLSGLPYVCVRNARAASITGIACKGFWGTTDMSLPGGSIPAGGTAVINFKSGKCEKTIIVHTRDGQPFEINGFDINANTILNITNQ